MEEFREEPTANPPEGTTGQGPSDAQLCRRQLLGSFLLAAFAIPTVLSQAVKAGNLVAGDDGEAKAMGSCSYGQSCGGGGGSCSYGQSCAGGGGKCSYGQSCGGGGGQCSYGQSCSGGGGKCSYGQSCGGS